LVSALVSNVQRTCPLCCKNHHIPHKDPAELGSIRARLKTTYMIDINYRTSMHGSEISPLPKVQCAVTCSACRQILDYRAVFSSRRPFGPGSGIVRDSPPSQKKQPQNKLHDRWERVWAVGSELYQGAPEGQVVMATIRVEVRSPAAAKQRRFLRPDNISAVF
jgi:hypothetical protein